MKLIMSAAAAAALLILLVFLLISRTPEWLVVSEPSFKSDAIVILNGHDIKGRILHGVSLYKQGLAPRIIISGLSELENETGICLQKVYAQSLGVPGTAIEIQAYSKSTYEDAVYINKMLKENGYRSFILVTSPLHSRRSKILFSRIIPSEIRWTVSSAAPADHFQKWWDNVTLSREVFYELLALPYCLLRKQ